MIAELSSACAIKGKILMAFFATLDGMDHANFNAMKCFPFKSLRNLKAKAPDARARTYITCALIARALTVLHEDRVNATDN